ncbi:MAG: LysR substrate-binding domain-containing protein [Thermoleophilia bacterium]
MRSRDTGRTADPDPLLRAPTMGELRAFLAVAEELHFARAARRLGVSPPSLSQTIRRMEDKLGAVVLVRTPRAVALTDAGQALVPRARDILTRLDEAQAAIDGEGTPHAGPLVVGIASNGFAELTAPIISAFRRARPGVGVTLRDVTAEPSPLLSGAVDVALVRPPFPEQWRPGVVLTEVVAEPRVALLPADHRLAAAPSISIADLADERFVEVGPGMDPIVDYWAATDAMGGRPALGAGATTVAGVLFAVAYLGNVITSIPSVLRFFGIPGVVAVPLDDVEGATMGVVTRAEPHSAVVADFVASVSRVASGGLDLVPGARMLVPGPSRQETALTV